MAFFVLEPVCEQANKEINKTAGRRMDLIRIARIFCTKVGH